MNTNALQGILWMLLTTLLFVMVTAVVRYIGDTIPAPQAAFIRYVIGTIILLPFIIPLIKKSITRKDLIIYIFRGLAHGFGVILWFYAMSRIPIAEVTAISYTGPIYISIGAAIFFGEKLALRRILAIIIAFIGTIIILRPGFQEISLGQLAQVISAPLFAISYLLSKELTKNHNSLVIVCMLSVFVTLTLTPPALSVWVQPTMKEIICLGFVAILATLGHITLTQAIKSAPIIIIQPISFLQLVWAVLIGYFIFSELVDIFVMVGGLIIIISVTYISYREMTLESKNKTPHNNLTKI
tara:strand:+ start:458 stop:1351 length:894 start_codon:yes stop_codon:yes gene_type:complete